MKNRKPYESDENLNSGAAIGFVLAVLVIGSSSMLPSTYFGEADSAVDYEFIDAKGKSTHVYRQTGRYLKAPVRFSNES